jgi:hypothetical protein
LLVRWDTEEASEELVGSAACEGTAESGEESSAKGSEAAAGGATGVAVAAGEEALQVVATCWKTGEEEPGNSSGEAGSDEAGRME